MPSKLAVFDHALIPSQTELTSTSRPSLDCRTRAKASAVFVVVDVVARYANRRTRKVSGVDRPARCEYTVSSLDERGRNATADTPASSCNSSCRWS